MPPLPAGTAARRPRPWEFTLVRLWHAALVGGFVVAYVTGDEDTYAMHLFSGWLTVALVALRLLAAWLAPANSPLRLHRPNRSMLLTWSVYGALGAAAVAAFTGVIADALPKAEHLHKGLGEFSIWVALAHVAVAVLVIKGRKWWGRLVPVSLAVILGLSLNPARAADSPARSAILSTYGSQAKIEIGGFDGFSAARGEALFRSRNGANPNTPSCTSCHGEDPAQSGRHVKTGRTIEPLAVSVNPGRFTDAERVEERFGRDCKAVLGRACTAVEKGDYITFMAGR